MSRSIVLFLLLTHTLAYFPIKSPIISSPKSLKQILFSLSSSTSTPLDSLLSELDSLRLNVLSEQSKSDSIYSNQLSDCNAEAEFRNQQVSESKIALEKAIKEHNYCNITKNQEQEQFNINLNNQKFLNIEIETNTQNEKNNREALDAKIKEHNDALEILGESVDLLAFFNENPTNLIQIAKNTANLVRKTRKIKLNSQIHGVLAALAQIMEKKNEKINIGIEKIRELIEKLRENILNSLNKEKEIIENEFQKINEKKNFLNEYLDSLKENQAKLIKNLDEMESCITIQHSIIITNNDKKDRNQELLEINKEMCQNFENQYKTSSEARKEEIKLIEEIKNIVEKRNKELPDGNIWEKN